MLSYTELTPPQIVYDGGDGQLFQVRGMNTVSCSSSVQSAIQCADLTLSNDFTIPSDVPCTNATGSASGSSTSSTVPASIETSAANGNRMSAGTVELLLGALGANFFVL
ncbi:hypothetical protein C0989_011078 [Termitomyces sp. Mn162]|nr:hypothetical protein C0989_011078 [Termitomyces sp. Mn162]